MVGPAKPASPTGPARDCPFCPRLVSYRQANAAAHPDWFNGAVPAFGDPKARLLVVGLAPGLSGANRTGRPFTGDFAGALLYETLLKFGFARGRYEARADDGLELVDAMIANAVACAPPQNKPSPAEIRTCRPFLAARLEGMPRLKAVVALGRIAHDSTVAALGLAPKHAPFGHAARHAAAQGFVLFDSYHCSRYNTNTGRLTAAMFEDVFEAARAHIGQAP